VLCDNKNLYNFPDDFRMTFASITSTYEQFPKPRLCQETWLHGGELRLSRHLEKNTDGDGCCSDIQ